MTDRTPRPIPGRRAPSAAALPSPLLSVSVVAELLGVSTKTVRRLITRGDLKAHRIGSGLRISEEDLRAYVARCR